MDIILTIIYMLIGLQISGRMFYWAIRVNKMYPEDKNTFSDFFVPLVLTPLFWPAILIISCFPSGAQNALWRWDK